MRIISFINMKGGVGKTTLSVNVAYGLAANHQKTVLIVDGDPQFSASQYLLEDDQYLSHLGDENKGTIQDIFVPRRMGPVNTVLGSSRASNRVKMPLDACTVPIFNGGPGRGKLDLIPSTLALMEIETSKRGTETKLGNYLKDKASGYDYVIIDCPPTISIFTQAAILASDSYLVPIKPDPLSVTGLPLLERWLDEFIEDAGLDISPIGLVFTLVRSPTPQRMKDVMADLRKNRKDEVFAAQLSVATAVAESVEAHKPVFQFKKNSKTARETIAITEEFLKRTSGE